MKHLALLLCLLLAGAAAANARLMVNQLSGFGVVGQSGKATCSCTTNFVTGDRTATIDTTSSNATLLNGTYTNLVDGLNGNHSTDSMTFNAVSDGQYLLFDYGAGNSFRVESLRWEQESASTHGTWTFEGSDDNSAYTALDSDFTLGGATSQTRTFTNNFGYRYYRLRKTGGATTNNIWNQECELDQCDCSA